MLTEEHLQQLVVLKMMYQFYQTGSWGTSRRASAAGGFRKKGWGRGKIPDFLLALAVYYSEQCLVFRSASYFITVPPFCKFFSPEQTENNINTLVSGFKISPVTFYRLSY